jgi:hypothetical protein
MSRRIINNRYQNAAKHRKVIRTAINMMVKNSYENDYRSEKPRLPSI